MRVPTYNLVYGTFASVPIFLFWLFCCWMVVLVGAEIAATLSYFGHASGSSGNTTERGPALQARNDANRLLDALASGEVSRDLPALRLRVPMPIDMAEDILHALVDARLVVADKRGRYRLAVPRESIQDADVDRALLT